MSNAALEAAIESVGGLTPLAEVCGVGVPVVFRARRSGVVTPKMAIRMTVGLGLPVTALRDLVPHLFDDTKPEGADRVD